MAQRPTNSSSRSRPALSRSLWGNLWAVLFRPGQFFDSFPHNSRGITQTAILALALLALSVWVALNPLSGSSSEPATPGMDMPIAPGDGLSVDPLGGAPMDGVIRRDVPSLAGETPDLSIGGPPLGGEQVVAGLSSDEVTAKWLKGLRALFGLALAWFLQALFLCEVPLLRGRRPDLSLNMRLAVWANLPLALLIGLQSLFVASGGQIGPPGLSGLVSDIPSYLDWPLLAREALMAFASQLTVFWLWSMALLYQSARRSLKGTRWMALLVVVLWMVSSTLLPTGLRLLGAAL